MAVLKNRAKMSTSTTGTGTITLGSAEDGYQTFADAGVANADVVRYVIEDGSNWEIGTGTYTSSGTTLSRTVSESSNADAAINLSGSATVFIGAAAEDIPALYAANEDSPAAQPSATTPNSIAIGESAVASGYPNAHAFGRNAQATGARSLAIGYGADATGTWSTALGNWNFTGPVSAGSNSVAIGGAYASGTDSFAAGISSTSSSYGSTGANSIAIGQLAKATQANSIAIGDTATSTTANQIALGGTTDTVKISGTYTLPTTDGSNGQVLTTDGSGAVTFADAGGGGGADLYTANASSPTANTVTGSNSAAIGSNVTVSGDNSFAAGTGGTATGYSSFAFGDGADATASHSVAIGGGAIQASGAQSIAIGYGSDATNTDAHAFGRNAQSTGSSSTAVGRDAVAATLRAMALGDSYANGVDSLSAAIASNTSSYGATATSSIAMGKNAKATGANAISISGENATASGSKSFAAGGEYPTASGAFSVALGGSVNTASGEASYAFGKRALASEVGKYAYGAQLVSTAGATQGGMMVLISATTDATPRKMGSNNSAGTYNNQLLLPNNSAYAFHGTIVARQQASGGTACAAWKVEGLIRREGSAGTTVLVNSATTVLDNTPSWGMALSADTTNGGLAITVTGAASTNIRWVATIHTSEVTYA